MIYLNIGRRRTGKTTLAYYMASRLADMPRIYFDPRGMIAPPEANIYRDANADTVKFAIDALRTHEHRFSSVVIRPGLDVESSFQAVARNLYEWSRYNESASYVWVIDEVRFVKDSLDLPEFGWLARCTNPERVHLILTCHRPTDVPTWLRAIADHWLVFRTKQEHDIKVLRERSDKLATVAARLEPRHFAHWDDGADLLEVNRRPESWYRPLITDGSALSTLDVEGEPYEPEDPTLF